MAARVGAARRRVGIGALVAALALGVVATPAPAPAAPAAAAAEARIAGHPVTELVEGAPSGRPPMAATWAEFRQVMGYTPATAVLPGDPAPRALKPAGTCSSPLGDTAFGFGQQCKAHDLGYDLLRFADRTGRTPGPEARRRLDDLFARDLHAKCAASRHGLGRLACDATADLYASVARLNSWRQRYGTP